jgi:hypothetical protein
MNGQNRAMLACLSAVNAAMKANLGPIVFLFLMEDSTFTLAVTNSKMEVQGCWEHLRRLLLTFNPSTAGSRAATELVRCHSASSAPNSLATPISLGFCGGPIWYAWREKGTKTRNIMMRCRFMDAQSLKAGGRSSKLSNTALFIVLSDMDGLFRRPLVKAGGERRRLAQLL